MDFIHHRLNSPEHALAPDALADIWFAQRIELIAFPDRPIGLDFGAVGKVRGAFGRVLAEWGSPAARDGQACTWSPPCAYHVLHQPRADLGQVNYAPAYLLDMQHNTDGTYLIRLTVHGFATEWLETAEAALIEGLNRGLNIGRLPLRFQILDRHLHTIEGLAPLEVTDSYDLLLKTPLGIRSGNEVGLSAARLFRSLRNQARSMARWQDALLDETGMDVSELSASAHLDMSRLRSSSHERRYSAKSKGSSKVPVQGWVGPTRISGVAPDLVPLLRLGQCIRAGSKISHGAGWFDVTPAA